jgi:putative two-component system response regulator
MIRLAAPMHDIGKIGIPDAILCKHGNLTAAEISIMQHHTLIGGQMLEGSFSPVLQMARDIALTHHEQWDGSGYPRGLVGTSIPEAGRIVSIVDVFDALSHARVYRPAFKDAEVEQMMWAGRGTRFDPHILDDFMSLRPEMWAIARLAMHGRIDVSDRHFDELRLPPSAEVVLP